MASGVRLPVVTPLQGITTQFHGPTNHRPSRITARSESGISVTTPVDHALTEDDRHARAVLALLKKLRWGTKHHMPGRWVGASIGPGRMAFVFCSKDDVQ